MASSPSELWKSIENLGNEIIRCKETKCKGIRRIQEQGIYPRAFFLEPRNAYPLEMAIIGRNPGKPEPGEPEKYIAAAKQRGGKYASYKDCQQIWEEISKKNPYFKKTRKLLQGLGLSMNGILWSEAVFCEGSVSDPTFDICSEKFLRRIIRLVPEEKYLICLSEDAYDCVGKLLSHNNRHKVIRVYHPRNPLFWKYLEEADSQKPKLEKIRKELAELNSTQKSYFRLLCTESRFFRSDSCRKTKARGRRSTNIFESVCTVEKDGKKCSKKFRIDRSHYRKPTDDPRIEHLRVDHGMKGEIRLRKRFKNRSLKQTQASS